MNFFATFQLNLTTNIAIFLVATIVVWRAGTRIVVYSDELAERFGIAREFIGLFLLAFITELPEIATTMTGAVAGNAALVLGNMFGGVTMQTAILAFVDIFFVHRALTSWPRKPTHALEAIFLIILMNILLLIVMLGDIEISASIGLGSIFLFATYPLIIGVLRKFDVRASWAPIDLPDEVEKVIRIGRVQDLQDWPSGKLLIHLAFTALVILLAGYTTANRAAIISEQSGLSSSFVGIAFLAAATSTPELSTSIAAARIGAYTMAISNIIGSNLIMIALIFPADIAYRAGPILAEADTAARFSIVTGILVTAIYAAGIIIRKTPQVLGAGLDSILVLIIYVTSLLVVLRI